MTFLEEFDKRQHVLADASDEARQAMERLQAELHFARELAEAHPAQRDAWQGLILQAIDAIAHGRASGMSFADAVRQAEDILAPLGEAAKAYTIHCVGHAHIDMNWQWNWPETVAVTGDTFTTMDRLMDEYPDFHFSQSQASVYQLCKDYFPELYARIKQRVAEGRWEITASQWVEGSKNLASGEILCRHLLYTRRFFAQEFGLPAEAIPIDWEPDTFGHAITVPTLLAAGGVRWYYFHRAGQGPMLFWWQAKDGSRVLAFDDNKRGYNGKIGPDITRLLFDFTRETGLKDFLFVYGVGDHGGGPTRRDLAMALRMDSWPIFPQIKLSTAAAFFRIAETAQHLPVITDELNFVFEGCYTSQSNIKLANRKSECALVEAEVAALLGHATAGMPYPADALQTGWRHAMFNQFHDILPGSGVKATYQYAQGLFQEILTHTGTVKSRALRAMAARVRTSGLGAGCEVPSVQAFGAGAGNASAQGGISTWSPGACCDPLVIVNPLPFARHEVVQARLWDRDFRGGHPVVVDADGRRIPAQVVEQGHYWGHDYVGVVFPVEVPATGYRTYAVGRSVEPLEAAGLCTATRDGVIENEFFRLQVAEHSAVITSLIDKRTGRELVPPGAGLGTLEYCLEAPHTASAWIIGQIIERTLLTHGTLQVTEGGPHRAAVRTVHRVGQSTLTLTIALSAGVPRIDFTLEANWLERGGPEIGVPMLRVVFPLAIAQPRATFAVPNGSIERPTNPAELQSQTRKMNYMQSPTHALGVQDVPALTWADVSGADRGATLLNDSKYGHRVDGDVLSLTLLRSTYEPDPLPELGAHTIRFALQPHGDAWTPADAARAGDGFNMPLNVVATGEHDGDLPAEQSFVEVLTPNVLVSGMKKAEDSEALILRLYEINGQPITAQVRLHPSLAAANAPAVQTDILEQPLPENTARMADGVLSVEMPAFGTVTVKLG